MVARIRSTSPTSSIPGEAAEQYLEQHRGLPGAPKIFAPINECSPHPNAMCGLGWRVTLNSSESGAEDVFVALADPYSITTTSPSAMRLPRISTSAVAVRAMCTTGLFHRSISSTAPGISEKSLISRAVLSD